MNSALRARLEHGKKNSKTAKRIRNAGHKNAKRQKRIG